ncbi:MAG TPA: YbaK/EbsC family protein [Streptosporangiaceae bacterium]|nr:YbaK/EbsC family protein [Streptosporangiaceae bacterium]
MSSQDFTSKSLEYLRSRGVSFVLKPHRRPALTCELAAEERGVRLSQIVKCMIGETGEAGESELVALLLPGDRKLKSSKARKSLGVRSLRLVSPELLKSEHGLIVGAISPVDLIGRAKVVMDPGVLEEEFVDISSGDPLAGIELSSKELKDVLDAEIAEIT